MQLATAPEKKTKQQSDFSSHFNKQKWHKYIYIAKLYYTITMTIRLSTLIISQEMIPWSFLGVVTFRTVRLAF